MLHIFAVILLGGTILLDTLTGMLLPRLSQAAELRAVMQVMRTNVFIGAVAAISVPLLGYATAAEGDFSLTTTWLLVAQVLFWAAIVASYSVLVPGSLWIARRAQELPDGSIPAEVMAELRTPCSRCWHAAHAVLRIHRPPDGRAAGLVVRRSRSVSRTGVAVPTGAVAGQRPRPRWPASRRRRE